MTQEEWLGAVQISPLITFSFQHTNARRVALLACGCLRCAQDWALPDREGDAVEATERYCDGEITRHTWRRRLGWLLLPDPAWNRSAPDWERRFRSIVADLFEEGERTVPYQLLTACKYLGLTEYAAVLEARFCGIHRDIYGNPFRPISFAPEWRTDTVLALAAQMYESRDFSAMPILADALQDAGCDSEEVLAHCREADQVHVRGCWVVDLVLDKP